MGEREPSFYNFLRKYHAAFRECIFLLPGLKSVMVQSSLSDVGKGVDEATPETVSGIVSISGDILFVRDWQAS
jgi:hypothetical protein